MKPPFKFPRTTTSEAFRTHLNRFPFEHNYLKKYLLPLALSSLVVLEAVTAQAQSTYLPYYFTTFAGNAPGGDGTGSQAGFYQPYGVAADSAGNVYVADTQNHTIRKITPAGVVTTLAGAVAVTGSADGTGSAALFNAPSGIAVDSAGNLYVADTYNFTIRKITSAGVVTTLAGTAGSAGRADGAGNGAQFYYPYGVAVDSGGEG